MKLFASLYMDEDVDILLTKLLQARGYDVTNARSSGLLGKADAEQLAHAVRQERVIVTHNRGDFEELHHLSLLNNRLHYGVIIAARRNPHDLCNRIIHLLDTLTADQFEGQLFYV